MMTINNKSMLCVFRLWCEKLHVDACALSSLWTSRTRETAAPLFFDFCLAPSLTLMRALVLGTVHARGWLALVQHLARQLSTGFRPPRRSSFGCLFIHWLAAGKISGTKQFAELRSALSVADPFWQQSVRLLPEILAPSSIYLLQYWSTIWLEMPWQLVHCTATSYCHHYRLVGSDFVFRWILIIGLRHSTPGTKRHMIHISSWFEILAAYNRVSYAFAAIEHTIRT